VLQRWENDDVQSRYFTTAKEALSVSSVSRGIDRIEVTFDEPNLVANAGLLLVATLVGRLGLEALINATVNLSGRVGGALPGRKILSLVHALVVGGSLLHARMRKGQANTQRGAVRFIEELVSRVRKAGATGQLVMRFDSGFWSNATIATLERLDGRQQQGRPRCVLVIAR
jgi:hypothetical protein